MEFIDVSQLSFILDLAPKACKDTLYLYYLVNYIANFIYSGFIYLFIFALWQ